jgi:pyridoxal phosphate enzyme (YggS family)
VDGTTGVVTDIAARTNREFELANALDVVRGRLAAAADAAGRNADEIELLPVTKFFPATDVAILFGLGCRSFGESREQEASAKVADVGRWAGSDAAPIQWHMVGQIQRNKARSLARWAQTVHSADSVRVVSALDGAVGAALQEGERTGPLQVYLQLSLDGDVSRGGVDISLPGAVDELCAEVAGCPNLELVGLMSIPPLTWDAEAAFTRLQAEHARVVEAHPGAVGLSAGMSGDLEVAIKHGSTCVRVGTALMGPRPLRSP